MINITADDARFCLEANFIAKQCEAVQSVTQSYTNLSLLLAIMKLLVTYYYEIACELQLWNWLLLTIMKLLVTYYYQIACYYYGSGCYLLLWNWWLLYYHKNWKCWKGVLRTCWQSQSNNKTITTICLTITLGPCTPAHFTAILSTLPVPLTTADIRWVPWLELTQNPSCLPPAWTCPPQSGPGCRWVCRWDHWRKECGCKSRWR